MAVRVLIRGVGDIGSAVAHRLFEAGYAVALHDGPQPTTTRRGMAFGALASIAPDVLIDARMRKHESPEPQRKLAPLTIGLGPNFVAGQTTDLVVETSWEQLGRVLTQGTSLPLRGEPRAIGDLVAAGTKVIEVDPRGDPALVRGIGEGVLEALRLASRVP